MADISALDLLNATLPVGTCGVDGSGWTHHSPIALHDGAGSALTPTGVFDGASVMNAEVVGYADLDRDGDLDALMSVECFGSLPERCCAGRASLLTFAIPVSLDELGQVEIIGSSIQGGSQREIASMRIDGDTVVTTEHVIYPESLTQAELGYPAGARVTATYRFEGDAWGVVREEW